MAKTIPIPVELLCIHLGDQLDTKLLNGQHRITWTDTNGEEIDIQEMEQKHLSNLFAWMCRTHPNYITACRLIGCEICRREAGLYPDEFESLVAYYMALPDTPRLKIYE